MLSCIKSSTAGICLNMKHLPLKLVFSWLRKQSPEHDHLPLILKFNWGQSFPPSQDLSSLLKVPFSGSQRTFPLVDLFKYFIPYIKLTVNFPYILYECFTSSPTGIQNILQASAMWFGRNYDIYVGECILCTNYHKVEYYITKNTSWIWKHLHIMLIRNQIPFYSN